MSIYSQLSTNEFVKPYKYLKQNFDIYDINKERKAINNFGMLDDNKYEESTNEIPDLENILFSKNEEDNNNNYEDNLYYKMKYDLETVSTDNSNNIQKANDKKNDDNSRNIQNIEEAKDIHPQKDVFKCIKISKELKRKNKNMGRKKKNQSYRSKIFHSKFSEDNLTIKIKNDFLNSCQLYINEKHDKFQLLNNKPRAKNPFLMMLSKKYKGFQSKDNEKKFLSMELGEVFSEQISKRCKKHNINHNRDNIKQLYEENEDIEIIDFLKNTVEDTFVKYIRDNDNKIEGFNYLDKLPKIEEGNEEESIRYREKYIETAKRFIEILNRPGRKKSSI